MRVVSLVPAATEIVWALGATDQLVAVTHDDDFPPAVLELPRVTRSTIPAGASARDIDRLVRDAGSRGESTFHLDEDALREARPDAILGQTLCAVCAITLDQIPARQKSFDDVKSRLELAVRGDDLGRVLGQTGGYQRALAGFEKHGAGLQGFRAAAERDRLAEAAR